MPLALANPGAFTTKTGRRRRLVALMPDNIWIPSRTVRHVRIFDGVAPAAIEKRYLSHSIATHAKPLWCCSAAAAARRLRAPPLPAPRAPEEALLLLALLFALRCALDPLSIAYYTPR